MAFLPLFSHATHSPFCSQTGISGNANLTRSAQSLQPHLTFNDPMDYSPTRCISLAPRRLAAPPCCWRDRGLVTLATVTCVVWEHTWQWAVSVYKPSSRMERCLSAGLAQLPRSLCTPEVRCPKKTCSKGSAFPPETALGVKSALSSPSLSSHTTPFRGFQGPCSPRSAYFLQDKMYPRLFLCFGVRPE